MNFIMMNFRNDVNMNEVYKQLKKLYPDAEIINNSDATEDLEDEYLLALAEERLKNDGRFISHEDMWERVGISEEDMEDVEADEFE